VLPSFVAGFSLFVVLARLVHEFAADPSACCYAPVLFLLSGGLGFVHYFDPTVRSNILVDFVHNWGNDHYEYWFQSVVHILMPQRASLFSMPLAWAVLLMLAVSAPDLPWFCAIGVLVALLPQVQPHSIVATAQYGAVHALLTFPFWRNAWFETVKRYLALALIATVLGAWQLQPFFSRLGVKTDQGSFVRICRLWLADNHYKRNFFTLWGNGLGLFFVLAIFVAPVVLTRRQQTLYAPALAVFLLANFVIYQPWSLDNTKIFNAGWIPLALAAVAHVIAKIRRWHALPALVVGALCVAAGSIAVWRTIAHPFPLWQDLRSVRSIAEFARRTPPKSVWITDSDHTHPIVVMAGKQTLAGYPGWLVSHGLVDTPRISAIQALAANPEDVKWADMWGVGYVCVVEKGKIPFAPKPGSRHWKLIWDNRPYRVWQRINETNPRRRPGGVGMPIKKS
jgi:hypothetical protein